MGCVPQKQLLFLTAQFYRRAARQGEKKAIVATAHQLLVIAFYILRDGTVYHKKGGNYFDQLNPERTQRKLMAATGTDGIRRYFAELDSPRSIALRATTSSSATRPPL